MNKIKVLGPGCTKCKKLAENVEEAISGSGKDVEFEYITDMGKIVEHGVMMTPALLVDGKVRSSGRVLSVKEISNIIES
jgi:small redox-active disulfide protein 2